MKKLKAILLLTFCLIGTVNTYSQQKDEVTLVVSADGTSKEEATKIALRNAIEQAYGTFVSANTTILNDKLVKDEIVTIASGNIKSYKELFCSTTNEGKTTVSLEAVVSISNLINYAKSKGSEAEFAGATFAMNLKMKELNKKNEEKALTNLLIQVQYLFNNAFDYELTIGEPTLSDNYEDEGKDIYILPLYVTASYNENLNNALELIWNTLNSLSLSQDEVEEYKIHNIETDNFMFAYTLNRSKYGHVMDFDSHNSYSLKRPIVGKPMVKEGKYKIMKYASRFKFTTRQPGILKILRLLLNEGISNFIINDNIGGQTSYEKMYFKDNDGDYYYTIHDVDGGLFKPNGFKCETMKDGDYGLIIAINPKHTLKIEKKIHSSELSKYNKFEIVRNNK